MTNKASYAMKLETLQTMLSDGSFHHATYRGFGTLWEGLWIYIRKDGGFRGFESAGSFPKDDPDLNSALELCRGTGISVGAYGKG